VTLAELLFPLGIEIIGTMRTNKNDVPTEMSTSEMEVINMFKKNPLLM
jgi:hypothetical protein